MIPVRLPSPKSSRSRYPVVKPEHRTVDGIVFDSGKEATRYAELKLWARAGEIENLECQPEYVLRVNGVVVGYFRPDFQYWKRDIMVLEEVKSTGTRKDTAYRLRRKLFEALYGFKITEIVR